MKGITQVKQRFKLYISDYQFLSVFVGLMLLQVAAFAQKQDPLEVAKLDIWTETASFVYRDANMQEPEAIAMANSLDTFVQAIKKEDAKSQIYSKLYRPIEETGTYRKGKDAKAQLDLLIKSINSRLRENEQRMRDINRRQHLSDLYKQLQQIASDYTTAPVQPSTTAVAPAGPITDSAVAGSGATAVNSQTVPDSGSNESYAENQLSSLAKKRVNNNNTDWMSIAALVLSLLSLGLMYFLYNSIKTLNLRMDQRKKELEALMQQVAGLDRKTPDNNGKLPVSAIESMVQKAIAKELARGKETQQPEVEVPQESIAAAPAVAAPVPLAVTPAEVAPAIEPVIAPAPSPAPDKPQSKFARVPVNGGFHEQDLNAMQQHDSIYEIRVSRKDPTKAAFRIVTNPNVHRSAIESAYLSLKDACNYQLNDQHASRIVTDEPGTLTYQDGFWHIDRKAQIHFE